MDAPSRRLSWSVWAGLSLTIALVGFVFVLSRLRLSVPVAKTPLPVYAQLGPFTLTNQIAQPVSLETLKGHVWVGDIIFSRCPGPCARMTRQMSDLQAHLPSDPRVKFVSLTTDPDFDQPEVLKRYGERFAAKAERWWFLTGTKPELARLAGDGLKFTSIEKKPEEQESAADLFIHSTAFVVVDQQGRLRAVFQTQPLEDPGIELKVDSEKAWAETKSKILAAVKSLLAEE